MHEDHDSDDGDLCLNTPQKHKKISKGRPYYKSSANNPSLTLYPQANVLSYHRCVQQTACALEGHKRLEAETSSTLYNSPAAPSRPSLPPSSSRAAGWSNRRGSRRRCPPPGRLADPFLLTFLLTWNTWCQTFSERYYQETSYGLCWLGCGMS